jgi:allantoicase
MDEERAPDEKTLSTQQRSTPAALSTLMDLAAERLGGAVLATSDEFFAPKENLLKASVPVFVEGKYTDVGKWMDGWESRRKRVPGHDWAIVRLGLPGIVRGVLVDTAYFKGNFPEACSIDACFADGIHDPGALAGEGIRWTEILPRTRLQGDSQNFFEVACRYRFTHLRLNIYPDGGVARLRVFGEGLAAWERLDWESAAFDLAAAEHGGLVVACSDMFFGSRHNLIMPGRALDMSDGWETRRRRGPGYDWSVVRLAAAGTVRRVEVDTSHFKGNYPESCSLEVCDAGAEDVADFDALPWRELLPRTTLYAHTRHLFADELVDCGPATHARLNIFPDGGVSRLRLFGPVTDEGRARAGLRRLNALAPEEAEAALLACCGSVAWARKLAAAGPFRTDAGLYEASDEVWRSLDPRDWLEAFGAHPKIGERKAGQPERSARWSDAEQAGARAADGDVLAAIAEANRQYESRFGYIFIVCATGKSADEMLDLARARFDNDPEAELHVAAEEQRRITRLRLERLLRQ